MDTTQTSWISRAEAAIRALRDVDMAMIQGEGEVVREIHVLTRSTRPAKQIVRDVQTVLLTRFNRSIDFRVVSVAYLNPDSPAPATGGNGHLQSRSDASEAPAARVEAAAPPPAPAEPQVEIRSAAYSPPVETNRDEPAPAAGVAPDAEPETAATSEERVRFGSVNLFVSGPRTQVQVELRWRGLPRMGSAAGWSTRAGANELVAAATLEAVREFLADEVAIGVQDLEILRLGRSRAVVVSLSLLLGRQEKILVGSCVVEQDVHQAVVFATLAAVNRVLAGWRPKEPTEYVLRPTSDK